MGFQVKYEWDSIIDLFLKEREKNNNISFNSFTQDKEYSSAALQQAIKRKGIVVNSIKGVGGGVKVSVDKHRDISLNLLDGFLLGDGSILFTNKSKNKMPVLSTSSKHREYLEWLQQYSLFNDRPIWLSDYIDKRTKQLYKGFWIRSGSSQYLLEQRNRWYPDGKKRLPYDININQETLLIFYLDDGSTASTGGLYLAADDLSFEEAETLIYKINLFTNLNLSIHKNGNNPRLYISKSQASDFLNIIGDYPVSCFDYKWQLK